MVQEFDQKLYVLLPSCIGLRGAMSFMIGLFSRVEHQRLSLLDASVGVVDQYPLGEHGIEARSPLGRLDSVRSGGSVGKEGTEYPLVCDRREGNRIVGN